MRYLLTILVIISLQAHAQGQWQKYDKTGKPVAIKLGPWHCARDNKTGLTWEVKSWHENPHYYKASYTWFDPQTNEGVKDGGSCQQGYEWYPCDVSDYIKYMNENAYCGIATWRLPTLKELKTLVYKKNIEGKLKINPYIFPRATRNRYMTADVANIKGKLHITMMDFLKVKIETRSVNVVASIRLVSG